MAGRLLSILRNTSSYREGWVDPGDYRGLGGPGSTHSADGYYDYRGLALPRLTALCLLVTEGLTACFNSTPALNYDP